MPSILRRGFRYTCTSEHAQGTVRPAYTPECHLPFKACVLTVHDYTFSAPVDGAGHSQLHGLLQ